MKLHAPQIVSEHSGRVKLYCGWGGTLKLHDGWRPVIHKPGRVLHVALRHDTVTCVMCLRGFAGIPRSPGRPLGPQRRLVLKRLSIEAIAWKLWMNDIVPKHEICRRVKQSKRWLHNTARRLGWPPRRHKQDYKLGVLAHIADGRLTRQQIADNYGVTRNAIDLIAWKAAHRSAP